MKKPNEAIAATIKKRRENRGLTQAELASSSGVPIRTVQKAEAGATIPRADTLFRISRALGLRDTDFWGEADPASSLSANAVNHLTAKDAAAAIERLADLAPSLRSFVLGILFDDPEIVEPGMRAAAFELLQSLRPASKGK